MLRNRGVEVVEERVGGASGVADSAGQEEDEETSGEKKRLG